MTNYFSYKELTKTDTGIDNSVKDEELQNVMFNLSKLRIVLNVVRALVDCPIRITSGYRNSRVNLAVGGETNSFHLTGRAADMFCADMPALIAICKKLYDRGVFVEFIHYPKKNIIHVAI